MELKEAVFQLFKGGCVMLVCGAIVELITILGWTNISLLLKAIVSLASKQVASEG